MAYEWMVLPSPGLLVESTPIPTVEQILAAEREERFITATKQEERIQEAKDRINRYNRINFLTIQEEQRQAETL